jgi:hypothetical protein
MNSVGFVPFLLKVLLCLIVFVSIRSFVVLCIGYVCDSYTCYNQLFSRQSCSRSMYLAKQRMFTGLTTRGRGRNWRQIRGRSSHLCLSGAVPRIRPQIRYPGINHVTISKTGHKPKIFFLLRVAHGVFVGYDTSQTVYRMYIRAQRMHMHTNVTIILSFSHQESSILVIQPGLS